jgi:tetratricopeptide (TPR) repeat protein
MFNKMFFKIALLVVSLNLVMPFSIQGSEDGMEQNRLYWDNIDSHLEKMFAKSWRTTRGRELDNAEKMMKLTLPNPVAAPPIEKKLYLWEKILNDYPYSELADDAQLCIADYFLNYKKEEERGIEELKKVINNYPNGIRYPPLALLLSFADYEAMVYSADFDSLYNYDKFAYAFEEYWKIDGEYTADKARSMLSQILYKRGQYKDATEELETIVKRFPNGRQKDEKMRKHYRSILNFGLGRYREHEKYALVSLASIYFKKLKNHEKGISYMEKYTQLYDNGYYTLGSYYEEVGRNADALSAYMKELNVVNERKIANQRIGQPIEIENKEIEKIQERINIIKNKLQGKN